MLSRGVAIEVPQLRVEGPELHKSVILSHCERYRNSWRLAKATSQSSEHLKVGVRGAIIPMAFVRMADFQVRCCLLFRSAITESVMRKKGNKN